MKTIHRLDPTRRRFFFKQARRFLSLACALALMLPVAPILGSGLTGQTSVALPDDGIGPAIARVALSFVKEGSTSAVTTTSDAGGRYAITLNPGRYYALATHRNFEDYTSAPGFVVVSGDAQQTANFFLREPRITTVLIVRHAEKSTAAGEPLSDPDGLARAKELGVDLLRAGITAVYSTNTARTLGTVKPLADLFGLPIRIYSAPAALKNTVMAEHRGDVVLVAGHSDTVGTLANKFGADVSTEVNNEYDNLYVVSVSGGANVVNMQYAADSPAKPEITRNERRAMTLLLVGPAAGSDAQEPEQLLHAARKAGVTAIFRSAGSNPLVAPLATALSLTPATFNGSDMPSFANQLISNHANGTVVVAGKKAELLELIRQLGGSPFPVIYDADIDHLIVVTRFKSGAIRVVPMRF